MKDAGGSPSISDEKARRLGVGKKSNGHARLILTVLLVVLVSVAGTYAYVAFARSHPGQTTTTSTTSSSTSPSTTTTVTTTSSTGFYATALQLQCGPDPQTVAAQVSCSATVEDSTPGTTIPPSGTVAFSGEGGAYGTPSCSASGIGLFCTVVYTPAPGSEGVHTLGAAYVGDNSHHGSTAQFSLTVTKRPTASTLSCSPATVPVNVGSGCVMEVDDTGTGTTSTPGGTASFVQNSQGTFSSPNCTLSGGKCSATFTPSPGSEGNVTLSASYAGDRDHSGSAASDTLAAIRRASSSTVTCTPSSTTVKAGAYCTATVKDSAPGTPTSPVGNFTFYSASTGSSFTPTPCSLVRVNSTSSNCGAHFNPSHVGTSQAVEGRYGGDRDHRASVAPAFSLSVAPRASSTHLLCTPSSVPVASPAGCTVAVSDAASGSPLPTGSVSFVSSGSGTFSASTCQLTSGSCTVSYTPLAGSEGSVTIVATYSGDGSYAASSASAMINVVMRQSSLTISCNPSTLPVNSDTTCTAKASDATATGSPIAPSGVVTFGASGGTFGGGPSCTLSAGSCSVTFTPSPGSEGSIPVSASYAGDADHTPSLAAPFTLAATTRSVSVSVSCPGPVSLGGSTKCTVTVGDNDTGGAIVPTGTVTFSSDVGGFSSTSCTLASGSCSVIFTPPVSLVPGTATITATYSGDADHAGGTGSTTVQYS